MFSCRECTRYCQYGKVNCPFFRGDHENKTIPELLERAKKKDRLSALYLAFCRAAGLRELKNPRAGISQLKRLAKKDPLAKGFLGLCYLDGSGVSRKNDKGFALCKEGACETECHQLERRVAECYENGIGTGVDRKEAERYRYLAANRGNEQLLMQVAGDLEHGSDDDVSRACEMYRRATQWGLPGGEERYRSLCRRRVDIAVGKWTYEGALKGERSNWERMAKFFLEDPYNYDARQGKNWYHAVAMERDAAALELAKLYLKGTHWEKDPGMAWWLLKQTVSSKEAEALRCQLEAEAAEKQEDDFQTPAQKTMLAERLLQTDPQRAMALLEESAAADCVCALEKLGVIYFLGQGVEADEAKAFGYLSRAWNSQRFSFGGKQIGGGSRLTGCYYAACFYFGKGTARNWDQAMEILQQIFDVDLGVGEKASAVKSEDMMAIRLQFLRSFLNRDALHYGKELVYGIYLLGRYLDDKGRKELAYEFFEQAAEQGLALACYDLALYGEQGVRMLPRITTFCPGEIVQLTQTPEMTFGYYQKAVDGGVEAAQYGLGSYYLEGKGTQQNISEGLRLLRQAAQNGNGKAWEKLGDHCRKSIGEQTDLAEAAACYEKAFVCGEPVIEKLLVCLKEEPELPLSEPSLCAALGKGYYEEKDYPKAVKWLKRAGEKLPPNGVFLLADCYRHGKGTAQDLGESFRLHKLAAQKGVVESIYVLGLCYRSGEGTEVDLQEAARLFLLAANRDHTDAQLMCGICYHNGEGVDRDYREAHKWYIRAAAKGCGAADRNLGVLYEFGYGVPQSLLEAELQYEMAKKGGFAGVEKDLERLKKKLEEKRKQQTVAAVQGKPAPTYSAPTYTAPSHTPTNYVSNPYESLDFDSSIRSVNRWLKTDLDLCSSEEEKKNVLARYQSNYPDIPLYETDTTYSPPDTLDDHDYLSLLNDIM